MTEKDISHITVRLTPKQIEKIVKLECAGEVNNRSALIRDGVDLILKKKAEAC